MNADRPAHRRPISRDVEWLINRTHIGTSFADVAADVADRIAAYNPAADQRPSYRLERAKAITDALIVHRRNRADYTRIMGGMR